MVLDLGFSKHPLRFILTSTLHTFCTLSTEKEQIMWFLQPIGSTVNTWKRPALWVASEDFWLDGVVGTRGEAVWQMLSAVSPLVSFCSTQGSRTEELYHTSPCHESFDCKYEGPFSGPPRACWSVVSGHSYSGPESGGSIDWQNPMGRASLTVHSSCRPQWPWRPCAEQKPSDQMSL